MLYFVLIQFQKDNDYLCIVFFMLCSCCCSFRIAMANECPLCHVMSLFVTIQQRIHLENYFVLYKAVVVQQLRILLHKISTFKKNTSIELMIMYFLKKKNRAEYFSHSCIFFGLHMYLSWLSSSHGMTLPLMYMDGLSNITLLVKTVVSN